jgi:hypothetical protein
MMDERAKSRMRAALDAYVDLHELPKPIAARTAIRSPFFSYTSFSRMGTSVLAFVLILLVGGGSAAYAAEGSVPGSPLYPVKVSIMEPVQGALITSAQGQASWHANLASRRLEEATTLAAANKLDPSTQEYLQQKFNTEVDASNQDADALAATGNTDAALDVRSDLEARITAHAEILAVITNHLETTATSTDPTLTGTKALLAAVQQRRQQVTEARLALEDTTNASTSVAIATLARAEVTTGAVASEANAQDDSSVAPVAAHLTEAKAALTMAKQSKGNATISSDDAHAAERSSEVASILLQHASLLRAFAPASTTASTTATTTATTDENKPGKDATTTDSKSDSNK